MVLEADLDNDTLTYFWEQTEGRKVKLENAEYSFLTFIAPPYYLSNSTSMWFELTVNDGNANSTSLVDGTSVRSD